MTKIEDIDRAIVRVWRWIETGFFAVAAFAFWALCLFVIVAVVKFFWRLVP